MRCMQNKAAKTNLEFDLGVFSFFHEKENSSFIVENFN